jgi:hypothetical protein
MHRLGEQVRMRAIALHLDVHPSLLPRLATFYITLSDLCAT